MKVLLVTAAFCIVGTLGALSRTQKRNLFDPATVSNCRDTYKLTQSQAQSAIEDLFQGATEPQKCLALCALRSKGAVDSQGKIVNSRFPQALALIGFNAAEKVRINANCAVSQTGRTACDRGVNLVVCLSNQAY